jgi:hypothetical protein
MERRQIAGRIGSVQQSKDGESYGFVIYDQNDRACVYLGLQHLARSRPSGAGGARFASRRAAVPAAAADGSNRGG